MDSSRRFSYSPWRHGGWYVDNVRYPTGAVGCVGRAPNRRWVIACDPRALELERTYATRDEAAGAEVQLIAAGQCRDLADSLTTGEGLNRSEVAGLLDVIAEQLEATA